MTALDFPNLHGKEIVIMYDYIEKFEPNDVLECLESLWELKLQIEALGFKVHFVSVYESVEEALKPFDKTKVVVFNWCEQLGSLKNSYHLIPEALDKLGFDYTGCDANCLLTTTDKVATKDLLTNSQVPTPKSTVYKVPQTSITNWDIFPAIVKPQAEHSSIGITADSIVTNSQDLLKMVNFVIQKFNGYALVEEFIDGPEYLVGVWGYKNPEMLPPLKLDFDKVANPKDKIYGFKSKWEPGSDAYENLQLGVPDIPEKTYKILENSAIQAYKGTGCTGYARFDIRVHNDIGYVLDVNANPDMAAYSEFLKSAQKLGYNYGSTVLKLCELSVEKNS